MHQNLTSRHQILMHKDGPRTETVDEMLVHVGHNKLLHDIRKITYKSILIKHLIITYIITSVF